MLFTSIIQPENVLRRIKMYKLNRKSGLKFRPLFLCPHKKTITQMSNRSLLVYLDNRFISLLPEQPTEGIIRQVVHQQ